MKNLLLSFLLIFCISIALSQEVIYTISASKDDQTTRLDSILFENLDNQTKFVVGNLPDLPAYDIDLTSQLLVTQVEQVGLPFKEDFRLIRNTPGEVSVQYSGKMLENVILSVYNMAGQTMFTQEVPVLSQNEVINVSIPSSGIYLLNISSSLGSINFRTLGSTQNFHGNFYFSISQQSLQASDVANTELSLKSSGLKDDFSFQIGDTIRITVYLEGYFAKPSYVQIVESAQFHFKMIAGEDTVPDSYTLNLEVYPTQAGNIQGAGEYQSGEQVSIIATANEGWQFVNWTGDTEYLDDANAANATVTMPAANVDLTANFELVDYTLTLSASPEIGGTVEDITYDAPYNIGDQVEINAEPNEGWEFVEWTGDTEDLDDANATNATVTMPAGDVDLTAHFEMVDYTLSLVVNQDEGGSVSGGGEYNFGDEIQIEATANEGWEFVNWIGDTEYLDNANAANATVTMPAANVDLTANFEMIDYTLSLTANPQYGGSVEGAGDYNIGEEVPVNATSEEGWEFVNWTGDTEYLEDANAANTIVTMPAHDVTLTANFEEEDTDTEVVDVTNPATGKTWMDRNLGASRAATSSTDAEAYGDLYQWGRAADGHQKRNSGTTSTLSASDMPGHGNFITKSDSPYDWRSPQNTNLWQGVNGVNNPCPPGYRLPTHAELNAERQSWSSNNSAGAFASPLKLPVAGLRGSSNGSLYNVGSGGDYWSSTVDGSYSRCLHFFSTGADMYDDYFRAGGLSVRCLKD